ncbi:MAG: tripartite tricarboxylate transporter TctB family protein [Spirochaetales bacterium]|nr:tripartite tricarboxylate transporter TctB family protein [Spirochaetales bacterium]
MKNPYLNSSVLTPIGIMVILLGYVAETFRMGGLIYQGLPTASFFPFVIFLLGFPVAVYLLVTGLLETKKNLPVQTDGEGSGCSETESEGFGIKPAHKPVLITLLTFIFIILFKFLGYTLTAPLYLFLFQLIYDDKLEHFPRKIITALIISVFVYVLYVGFFNILFPEVWK